MGETAEDCEDPLSLLDPKEELLSETESMESDKADGQSCKDMKTKDTHPSLVASPTTTTAATTTTAVVSSVGKIVTTYNNNGKFLIPYRSQFLASVAFLYVY